MSALDLTDDLTGMILKIMSAGILRAVRDAQDRSFDAEVNSMICPPGAFDAIPQVGPIQLLMAEPDSSFGPRAFGQWTGGEGGAVSVALLEDWVDDVVHTGWIDADDTLCLAVDARDGSGRPTKGTFCSWEADFDSQACRWTAQLATWSGTLHWHDETNESWSLSSDG